MLSANHQSGTYFNSQTDAASYYKVLYLPVAGHAAELPGVLLVRAADAVGNRDILSLYYISCLRRHNPPRLEMKKETC